MQDIKVRLDVYILKIIVHWTGKDCTVDRHISKRLRDKYAHNFYKYNNCNFFVSFSIKRYLNILLLKIHRVRCKTSTCKLMYFLSVLLLHNFTYNSFDMTTSVTLRTAFIKFIKLCAAAAILFWREAEILRCYSQILYFLYSMFPNLH